MGEMVREHNLDVNVEEASDMELKESEDRGRVEYEQQRMGLYRLWK